MFDIRGLVAQLGTQHYVIELEKSFNSRGDATVLKKTYPITGIVQVMSGEDEEVNEGILSAGDIIAFYDEFQKNLKHLKLGNQIYYNGTYYTIKNVIPNQGHVEVQAVKT